MKKAVKYPLIALVVIVIALFFGFKKNINLKGLHTYDAPHFTIYYEALAPQTLQDLEQKLETHYPGINRFFGLDDQGEWKIVVYRDVGRFQRAYLGFLLSCLFGDWAVGAGYEDMVLITSPENPGSQHTYADILDIAVHEYIHTLTYQLNETPDIWLDEGLATYLAGQESQLPTAAPSFEQMQSQDQGEFVDNDGYAWGYAYVEYLITTYGTENVIALVKTNDYERCLGKPKLAVYDEWVVQLSK